MTDDNVVRIVPQWMRETPPAPSDLERRIETFERRQEKQSELLVFTISVVMVVIVGLWLQPQGAVSAIVMTAGVMAITGYLARRHLRV